MSVVEEILLLFNQRGAGAYFGERVSMSEHALQAAFFAQHDGAPRALVVAALLHDVGHLLAELPDDIADWRADVRHEELGGQWLANRFGAEVFEPVRLHVPAKRYLCATDAQYFAKLSPASVHTLELQGGPMAPSETTRFEAERFFREAVRVRQWDDQGKIAGLSTPKLPSYGPMIEDLLARRS
jgi:[1-hydroxy-2-(trimethylamino)ethyl]phosphonate dioxygenase